MGCVLSPDKAKLLCNTVVAAIDLMVRGVRLWGTHKADGADDRDVDSTWRAIAQAAYADDWVGCFETLAELKKAWAIWRLWDGVSGSKIGVKGFLKTVVTGVRYEGDRVVSMEDPLLRMRNGMFVPFAHYSSNYKHVGSMRQSDGGEEEAWRQLSRKFDAALARLRKLRRPSRNEFILTSNALLGGLASYYLQTLYITFEQAEEVERKWRAI